MAPKKTEKEEKVAITTSKTPATKRVTPTESATAEKNVRLQSSNESAEAFLRKLKANRHEPLPAPHQGGSSGRGGALAFVLVLCVLGGGAGFAYYQGLLPASLPFNIPFLNESEAPSNEVTTPGQDVDELAVGVPSNQLSLGTETTVSVGVPSDASEGETQLYLLNTSGAIVGFVGNVPSGQSSLVWNPQNVMQVDAEGEEYMQAPSPGSYRMLLALRPQGDDRDALQLEKSATSSSFTFSYDEITRSNEVAFETCLNIDEYSDQQWYSTLTEQASAQGVDLDAVTVSCYSPEGELLVFVASGEGLANYPLVARFDAQAGMLRTAVYTGARSDASVENAPATFGLRDGTTIPIIVNGATTFIYDFIKNTVDEVE